MRKLYLLLMILCCHFSIFAQRDYSMYQSDDYKSDTIVVKDYAYICDTLHDYEINLYNRKNHPGRGKVCYKDGTPKQQGVDVVYFSKSTNTLLHDIVDEGFTQEQIENIDCKRLIVIIDISTSNGCITDVYFTFFKDTHYAQLPIEVYRAMELRFKNDVQFELTEEGKNLTHYSIAWSQCPKGRAEEVSEDETEQETDNSNNNGLKTDLGGAITDRGSIGSVGGNGLLPTIGGR